VYQSVDPEGKKKGMLTIFRQKRKGRVKSSCGKGRRVESNSGRGIGKVPTGGLQGAFVGDREEKRRGGFSNITLIGRGGKYSTGGGYHSRKTRGGKKGGCFPV